MTLPKGHDPTKLPPGSRKKNIYDYGKTITIIGAIMLGVGLISFGIILGDMQTTPKSAFISGYDMHPSIPEYRTIFASEDNLRIEFDVEPLYVPFKILILNEENQVVFDKTFTGNLNEIITVSKEKKYDVTVENKGSKIAYVFGSIKNENINSEIPFSATIFAVLIIIGILGLIVLIIGIILWPKGHQSINEKKVLKMFGFAILFIAIGGIATPFVLAVNGCLETKNNYETNSEFAIEKYRYDTFEEWLIAGAPGKMTSNCVPIIENLLQNLFV
jgi:hypothetical protein